MSGPAWIAFGGMALTMLLNVAGWLVAWGAMKSTVKALGERVCALEMEIAILAELRVQVARVETRMDAFVEQLRDLNATLRWLRADAPPDTGPAAAALGGRRRARLS